MIRKEHIAMPLDFVGNMAREQADIDPVLNWIDQRGLNPVEKLLIVYEFYRESSGHLTEFGRKKLNRTIRELWVEIMM